MSCLSILVLWDTQNSDSDTQTIKNNFDSYLRRRYFVQQGDQRTVEFFYANIRTYDGTNPTANNFNAIFHVHTYNDETNFIPVAGQTALTNYVNTGGVYVGSSWMSYDDSYDNYNTNMGNLLLYNKFSSFTKTNYGLSKHNFIIASGARDTYSGIFNPVGGTPGVNNNGDNNLNYDLSANDLQYVNDISTNDFTHSTRATDVSHNAGVDGINLIFMFNNDGGDPHAVPYLVKKNYGQGIVFGVNDSFDATALSGNRFNSPLRADFTTDGYLKNILRSLDISIKGSHCTPSYGNICFVAGTLVSTDQGEIKINKIIPGKHTIDNKKILYVTETISSDKNLVKIGKNSIQNNVPNKDIIMTKNHIVEIGPLKFEAEELINKKDITLVPYNDEYLYNILMENYNFITVQNLRVETLHPANTFSKIINSKYDKITKSKMLIEYNNIVKDDKKEKLGKLDKSLKKKKNKKTLLNKKLLFIN